MSERELPPEFLEILDGLERSYLLETDPIRGSGFGGGPGRWRAEREPLLDGVFGDGNILDVGCANGYLLECLVRWGAERGLRLVPHGVDRSPALVEQARARLPEFAGNIHVADAWTWTPTRRYEYVYVLHDCVPLDYLAELLTRVFKRAVAPGGRMIVGAYGSRSRGVAPLDIADFLELHGWQVSGQSAGGTPPVSTFAWLEKSWACE
jgi:SAM-dependent methyltransferase